MFLPILALAAIVCAHFEVTYPKGIKVEDFAKECNIDPDARVYPWNPKGSPLGLNQHVDKSLVDIVFCAGSYGADDSDTDDCYSVGWYAQPYGGRTCIHSLNLYADEGTNGTLLIHYMEGEGPVDTVACFPVTISSSGPLWEGDNCEADKNTGFQEIDAVFWQDIYGPSILEDMFPDGEYLDYEVVNVSYVTDTVFDGKTSDVYQFVLEDSLGHLTTPDTSTVTHDPDVWATHLFVKLNITIDGSEQVYNPTLPAKVNVVASTTKSDTKSGDPSGTSSGARSSISGGSENTSPSSSSSTSSSSSSSSSSASTSTSTGIGSVVGISGFVLAMVAFAAGLL